MDSNLPAETVRLEHFISEPDKVNGSRLVGLRFIVGEGTDEAEIFFPELGHGEPAVSVRALGGDEWPLFKLESVIAHLTALATDPMVKRITAGRPV